MNQRQKPITAPGDRLTSLLLLFGVTALAAAVGAIASVNAPDFYTVLAKPTWAPSAGVFGPIWTMLYLLMTFAAWLVWQKAGLNAAKGPLALYLLQLALNALWTWLFFRWRLGGWTLMEIIVLAHTGTRGGASPALLYVAYLRHGTDGQNLAAQPGCALKIK